MLKFKNILSNWLVFAFNVIIAFLLTPYLVKCLGDVEYGIWIFASSITGYMGLMTMGIYPTINKYVAEYFALNDTKSLNTLLGTCRILLFGAGIVSIIIGVVLSLTIQNVLKGIYDSLYNARIVIIILSVHIFLSFIFNVYESILVGLQEFKITRALNLGNLLIRSLIVFVLLYKGYRIIAIALTTMLMYVIECLFQRHYTYKKIPTLNMSISNRDISKLKSVIGFSGYIFLIILASRIAFQTDAIVIGFYMNAAMITYFSIASSLIIYAGQLLNGIAGVVFPLASELHAKLEKEKLVSLFTDSTRYSILISIPICIGFICLGGDFIKLWMGEKYQHISGNILIILAIGQIVSLSQVCTYVINICTGNHKNIALLLVAEASINLLLSIILVQKFGLYGVAWGTTVPIIIFRFFIIPVITTRHLEIIYLEYIKETYLKILPSLIALIITMVAMTHIKSINNWISFIIVGTVPVVMYSIVVYITYLKTNEIIYIHQKYRKLLFGLGVYS